MRNRIAADDAIDARRLQGGVTIAGKQGMDDDANRRRHAGNPDLHGGRNHGPGGGDDIVNQNRRHANPERRIGYRDADLPILAPGVGQGHVRAIGGGGDLCNPRLALQTGTENDGLCDMHVDPVGDGRCRGNDPRRYTVDIGKLLVPLQWWIDRHQPIAANRQQSGNVPGRFALAGMARNILSDVREIGNDKADATCAKFARHACHEVQSQQAIIGAIKRPGKNDVAPAYRRRESRTLLAVRVLMQVQHPGIAGKSVNQAESEIARVRSSKQQWLQIFPTLPSSANVLYALSCLSSSAGPCSPDRGSFK